VQTIATAALLAAILVLTASCGAKRKDEAMTYGTAGKNRLAQEKSPYLLQHADNPVDWYPWGEEAFAAARAQDKPIFLSIGYSTCHWCHVMEHESFENDSIARLMNDLFICIKVDREERPDVDQIYMRAVQAITRQGGGWPLSVFLTPDLKPFFGGSYFPPEDRYGRPGFPSVLRQMSEIYRTRRDEIDRVTADVTKFLQTGPEVQAEPLPATVLDTAYEQLRRSFDAVWGGFGSAPKFPRSMTLSFLMRYSLRGSDSLAREMAVQTLDKMAGGGMFDHLGGGFHRYSTDREWLVPHFEKMLYDNALLARTYIEALQLTANPRYGRVARHVLDYMIRDLRAPEGAFFSAEDAGSEGEEGKFYVWSRAEVDSILGERSALFCEYYDVSDSGNFEGANILWTPRSLDAVVRVHGLNAEELAQAFAADRSRLLAARNQRVRPHRDEKILTSWNGLAIGALAVAYQVLDEPAYLDAARRAADFILAEMWDGATLKARWAGGEIRYDGYLDDYAFLAWGLFDLYEASFAPEYLKAALAVLDAAEAKFTTPEGGYFFAPASNAELLARPQEVYDGALPSGVSVMALNLLRRAEYTGNLAFRDRAADLFRAYRGEVEEYAAGFPQLMCALDYYYGQPREVVLAGSPDAAAPLLHALRRQFLPNKVVLFKAPDDAGLADLAPIVKGKDGAPGEVLAYVCRDFTCKLPTADPKEMLELLR